MAGHRSQRSNAINANTADEKQFKMTTEEDNTLLSFALGALIVGTDIDVDVGVMIVKFALTAD